MNNSERYIWVETLTRQLWRQNLAWLLWQEGLKNLKNLLSYFQARKNLQLEIAAEMKKKQALLDRDKSLSPTASSHSIYV